MFPFKKHYLNLSNFLGFCKFFNDFKETLFFIQNSFDQECTFGSKLIRDVVSQFFINLRRDFQENCLRPPYGPLVKGALESNTVLDACCSVCSWGLLP